MYAVWGWLWGGRAPWLEARTSHGTGADQGQVRSTLRTRYTGTLTLGIEDAALIFDGEAEKSGTRGAALRGQPSYSV